MINVHFGNEGKVYVPDAEIPRSMPMPVSRPVSEFQPIDTARLSARTHRPPLSVLPSRPRNFQRSVVAEFHPVDFEKMHPRVGRPRRPPPSVSSAGLQEKNLDSKQEKG
jgi:hypothetical protein